MSNDHTYRQAALAEYRRALAYIADTIDGYNEVAPDGPDVVARIPASLLRGLATLAVIGVPPNAEDRRHLADLRSDNANLDAIAHVYRELRVGWLSLEIQTAVDEYQRQGGKIVSKDPKVRDCQIALIEAADALDRGYLGITRDDEEGMNYLIAGAFLEQSFEGGWVADEVDGGFIYDLDNPDDASGGAL